MTHNKETKEYVIKKINEGKNNGCIINNIRNKIIHRVFAVIREQNAFEQGYKCEMQKKTYQETDRTDTPFNNFLQIN